jgi:serine/threonine protein kinase
VDRRSYAERRLPPPGRTSSGEGPEGSSLSESGASSSERRREKRPPRLDDSPGAAGARSSKSLGGVIVGSVGYEPGGDSAPLSPGSVKAREYAVASQQERSKQMQTGFEQLDVTVTSKSSEDVDEYVEVPLDQLESISDPEMLSIGGIARWQRGNLVGSGSFGKVYLGMNLDTGELFIVKQVFYGARGGAAATEEVIQLEQEIGLLSTLQHENIVQYLGTERNTVTQELSIFLEHMPGGSVAELVERFGKLDEAVISKYTREVLEGLMYLHERGIIHRDIKGQNILVDNRGTCKLADFGASRYMQQDTGANLSFKGTPVFMSPEVIMEQKYSKKSDVWSVGCTLLQMATGNPPFSEFSNHIAALFHITSSTEPPPVPETISEDAQAFVRECFIRDPKLRPHAHQLRRHRFLKRKTPVAGTPVAGLQSPGTRLAPGAAIERTPSYSRTPASAHASGGGADTILAAALNEQQMEESQYETFRREAMKEAKANVKARVRRNTSRIDGLDTSTLTGSEMRSQRMAEMGSNLLERGEMGLVRSASESGQR